MNEMEASGGNLFFFISVLASVICFSFSFLIIFIDLFLNLFIYVKVEMDLRRSQQDFMMY